MLTGCNVTLHPQECERGSDGGEERKEGETGLMGTDGWKVKAWRVVECSRAQHRGNSLRGDVLSS